MKLVNRASFGWSASLAGRANPRAGIVIHYDGSDQGLAKKPHTACITYWKNTRTFHVGPRRGWADIGYSFGACPHGVIFEGRGLGKVQAAQPGGNATWYSVSLMSGPSEDPTPEQVDAVRQLRAWLMSKGVKAGVRGHRDFYSTSCPGDRLYRLVKDGTFAGAASTSREDDEVSAKELWQHELPVPFGSEKNPEWQAGNILVNIAKWGLEQREMLAELTAKVETQGATIQALAELVERMQARLDAPDSP